jgi:glycosyltransferase involved in cell wall biosynthesis
VTRRVLIVQELLPHYRVEFFRRLATRLDADGVELTVAHGVADPSRAARADAGRLDSALVVRNRYLSLGPLRLVWQPVLLLARRFDLVVVEQANRLAVNYPLIAWGRAGGPRLGLWAHGRNWQSRRPTGIRERWKGWWLRLPHWWFGYTNAVAADLVRAGCPAQRVTGVQNSIEPACPDGPVTDKVAGRSVFLGSLYDDKRLDVLLAAADLVASARSDFSLRVLGDGPLRPWLEVAATSRPWLGVCGPLLGAALAEQLSQAQLMLCPGLVGLAAIEAFAAEAPMVTIDWPHHSPEINYLVDGDNAVVLPAGSQAADFAHEVGALLDDVKRLERLRRGCCTARNQLTLDAMVDNFAAGVRGALGG